MNKKIRIIMALLGGLVVFSATTGSAADSLSVDSQNANTAQYRTSTITRSTLKTKENRSLQAHYELTFPGEQSEPVKQRSDSASIVLASVSPKSIENVYSLDDSIPDLKIEQNKRLHSTNQQMTFQELDELVNNQQNNYLYSEQEKIYIARVVYAEARGESAEGQIAVATVVINRFESGDFGSTVKRVAFARSQFAVSKKYNKQVMASVERAIALRGTFPSDMYYFQASKSKNWRNFEYYTRIGGHSFYCAAD